MDIELHIKEQLAGAFEALYSHSVKAGELSLQPTRKDFAGSHTFITFPYARVSKKNPAQTAEELGNYLKAHTDEVVNFNVVKGFLNLELADSVWTGILADVVNHNEQQAGAPYGFQPASGQQVVVEFSSPNTNKPLHLGHLRNNFLGFSVAQILEANGYTVKKVNLVNDRGIHICKSMLAYERFGNGETPESSGLKGDHLVGKYYVEFDKAYRKEIEQLVSDGVPKEEAEKEAPLLKAAQAMLQAWEQGDDEVVALWNKMNGWVYEGFDETYRKIGVHFDKTYHESETFLLGKDLVKEGLEKGVFFTKENGSVWVDLTEDKLDEKLLLRADGTSVYMTQDLGTAELRYNDFPFVKSIYTVGNEQDYHFKVLFTILKKLGRSYADGLYHLSYGMVDLPGGRMKSREGTVVDADDLIQEMVQTAQKHTEESGKIETLSQEEAEALYHMLGTGAIKYFLLKVDPRKRMLFNPEESVQFQGNTAPFIQYTHARIASLLRRGKADKVPESVNFSAVKQLHEAERSVIQLLADFPHKVQLAGAEYAPSVIAQYAFDLAKEYNRYYAEVPIFAEKDNISLISFRLAFSAAVARTLQLAMKLLGIAVPDRM